MLDLYAVYVKPFPQCCKECPFYEAETYLMGLIKTGRFFCHALDHTYSFEYSKEYPSLSLEESGWFFDHFKLPSCPLKRWDSSIKEREIKEGEKQ